MTLTYDIHDSISLMKTSFQADFLQLIWPKLQNRRCANFRSILQKKIHFGNGGESDYFVSVLFLI